MNKITELKDKVIGVDNKTLPNEDNWQGLEHFVKQANAEHLTFRWEQLKTLLKAFKNTDFANKIKQDADTKAQGGLKDLADDKAIDWVNDCLSEAVRFCEGHL